MTEISILDMIGEPAMYEQLAEEANELAHAAQKMARIQRGENPTPVTDEALKKIRRWIPVTERLPEKNKSVLLCMKSRSSSGTCLQTGSIDNGFWFVQSYPGFQSLANCEFHVIAWMPLPEPYEEGK